MSEEPEITLKDIHDDLMELIKWTKISSYEQVKKLLESVLNTETKKIVYQLSDGEIGVVEAVKQSKSSKDFVSKYWNQWSKFGIGITVSVQGGKRFKRSFDLDDFGLLSEQVSIKTNSKEVE